MEFGNGQFNSPSLIEGYLLHKIDLNTGKTIWVLQNNFFSGNEYLYTPFGGNMHFLDNQNIAVNGFKSIDPISEFTNEGFNSNVYTNIMRQEIDGENGAILNERVHVDTAKVLKNRHPTLLLREASAGNQVKYFIEYRQIDGTMRTLLHIYGVDPSGMVSEDPLLVYEYDSMIQTDLTWLSYPTSYHQITPETGVAIFGRVDPVIGGQPQDVKLVFFDTSNLPEITVKKEVSVLDIFPQPQHNFTKFARIYPVDGEVVITQVAILGEDEIEDQYTWLARYDSEGNLVQKIDRSMIDSTDIDFIVSLRIINDDLYVLAFSNDLDPENLSRYFLTKYTTDGEQINLGDFYKKQEYDDHRIVILSFDILDNQDVLMYINDKYPLDWYPLDANASYLVRFKGEDFGLTTSAADIENETTKILVFPNPVQNVLFVEGVDLSVNEWDVVNILGQSVREGITEENNTLEMSGLLTGAYFIKIKHDFFITSIPFIKK